MKVATVVKSRTQIESIKHDNVLRVHRPIRLMKQHFEVKGEEASRFLTRLSTERSASKSEHWTKAMEIDKQLENRREKIIETLRPFECMREGHVGKISQMDPHIGLELASRHFSISPLPHRTSDTIDRM